MPLLVEYPKCYWIWKYRRWILEQAISRLPASAAAQVWEAELGLTSKMLARDRRNFHAWSYRRHLVARLEGAALLGRSLAADEFAYTTRMIGADLSNFSAWHNRGRLLARKLEDEDEGGGADDAARAAVLRAELDLVQDALDVGPEDQSLWYYHRYILWQLVAAADADDTDGRRRPSSLVPNLTAEERAGHLARGVAFVKDLLQDYDDVKWVYEALLEYYMLARREFGQPGPGGRGAQEGDDDPRVWLARLRELDPMQAGRWDDVERRLDDLPGSTEGSV
ncbi:protein prenylyltransferase [Xylariaceae sp. FL0804]|nr:protein prenylyltransferase [Xylariaceae sp. FL0804]